MTETVVPIHAQRRIPAWEWSDRVRRVRKDLRMTQAEFAALTGYGDKRIAAWEAGRNKPDNIGAIAVSLERTTGVDRQWWIGWADGQTDPPGRSVNSGCSRHRVRSLATMPEITGLRPVA